MCSEPACTSLRSASHGGPGIELPEYRTPNSGRIMPPDTQANDLWHWQVQVTLSDAAVIKDTIANVKSYPVSNAVIDLPKDTLDYSSAFMIRDPDGHAMLLTKP